MIKYFVAILAAVVVLAGGFYFVRISDQNNGPTAQDTSTDQQNSHDAYADWKTYLDEDIGFSFRYPSQWDLDQSNNLYLRLNPESFLSSATQGDSEPPAAFLSLIIKTDVIVPQERANKINESLQLDNFQQENLTVDKFNAISIEGKVSSESYITGNYYQALFLSGKKHGLELIVVHQSKDEVHRPEVKQIINSLNFSDEF